MQLEEEEEAPVEEVEVVEEAAPVREGRASRSRIGCFRGVAVVLCGYVSYHSITYTLSNPLPLLPKEQRSTLTQPIFSPLGTFPNIKYPIHAQRADADVREPATAFGKGERSSDADECDELEGWWE